MLIILALNLTDWLIDTFGWSFTQLLWPIFEGIYDGLLNFFGPAYEPMLTTVWEVLFT